jgi:hypothetical protein
MAGGVNEEVSALTNALPKASAKKQQHNLKKYIWRIGYPPGVAILQIVSLFYSIS